MAFLSLPLDNKTTMHITAYNGSQVKIDDICRNWQPLSSACFPSWPSREPGRQWQKMVENGKKWISAGKWQKMDFRVFLVNPLLLRTIESDDISTIILCD